MSPTTFHSAYGDFTLLRRPSTPHLPLQAWDAADEYLLTESRTTNTTAEPRVLIINDQFGALAAALHHTDVCSWSDSYTAHRATLDNFARNRLDASRLVLLPSTQIAQPSKQAPIQNFDLVLWRIPKTLALFQQQARTLRAWVNDGAVVLAGGMQKHLPPRTLDILKQIGAVDALPTTKKARVFLLRLHCNDRQQRNDEQMRNDELQCDDDAQPIESPPLSIDEYGLRLHADANVFARDTFDIGARFFLEQFDQLPRAQRIADLGCGNGVLGIVAKQQLPTAQIEFFDESYQAIAAAEKNYTANGLSELPPAAKFHVDDVFANYADDPFDLILCNPPFHQGHVVGDHIAWEMFTQSKKNLRSGGELWIVGNRHLDYHIKLKKIFGNCRQIAANAKFVVLAARVN